MKRLDLAQQALVESTKSKALARNVANHYGARYPHARRDDLRSLANEALVFAAFRFDPTLGISFQTFAYKRVIGHITKNLGLEWRYQKRWGGLRNRLTPVMLDQPAAHDYALRQVDGLSNTILGSPEQALDAKQSLDKLALAREDLSDSEARLVKRHYEDSVSLTDVAGEMGRSRATTTRRHQRILNKLRWDLHDGGVDSK